MKRRTAIALLLTLILTTADWVVGIKLNTPKRTFTTKKKISHSPFPIFQLEPALANPRTEEAQTNVGRIIIVEGQVELKRPDWSDYHPVPINTQLYQGDLLWPTQGARVVVICANGQTWTVPAGVPSGANNGCPLPRRPKPTMERRNPTDSQIASNIPYIISPRNTAILNTKPILRWNPIPDATRYTVRVSGSGVDWQTSVSTPEVVYPGEPPLEPDVDYSLFVSADNTKTFTQTTFRLLDQDEAQQVQAETEKFIQPQWTTEAKALVLADLYTEHQLIAEAIETLEVLVNRGSQIPAIYSTLGNLYLQVGLHPLAQQHYLKAIALATDANDLAGEIAAQQGLINLARAYILLKNSTAAQELLQKDFDWRAEENVSYYRLTYQGWLRLEQSHLAEAQTYLQQAIDLERQPGPAYCLLGQVREAQGDSTGAKIALERCQQELSAPSAERLPT